MDFDAMFGQSLRRHRLAAGMTLQALADLAGCSKAYLSQLENGRPGRPSDAVLQRLEGLLGFPEGELLRLAYLKSAPAAVSQRYMELQLENAALRGSQAPSESGAGREARAETAAWKALSGAMARSDVPVRKLPMIDEGARQWFSRGSDATRVVVMGWPSDHGVGLLRLTSKRFHPRYLAASIRLVLKGDVVVGDDVVVRSSAGPALVGRLSGVNGDRLTLASLSGQDSAVVIAAGGRSVFRLGDAVAIVQPSTGEETFALGSAVMEPPAQPRSGPKRFGEQLDEWID